MLARLQRFLVFAALLLTAAAVAWAVHRGWPGWAVGLIGVLGLAPHAPVLAFEFACLARVGRDGAAPVPAAAQLLRAWAHEVVYGLQVFAWRQPFREQAVRDVPGQPGRRGVLLVHGFVCNRGLWAPWMRRFAAEGVPCRAVTLEPVFGSIDDYAPTLDQAVAALQAETGQPPLVVAHSMGGLAVRAWLAGSPDRLRRVAHVVTIGTPHHGTWLARWAVTANGRQMRLASPWLQALARRESLQAPQLARRFTCFFGHADNIVFPPGTATLPGADNRHLPATAHVQLAFHPEVQAEVQRLLRELPLTA